MRRAALLAVLVAALLAVPAAQANGDPASDILHHPAGLPALRGSDLAVGQRRADQDRRRGEQARLHDPRRGDRVHRRPRHRRQPLAPPAGLREVPRQRARVLLLEPAAHRDAVRLRLLPRQEADGEGAAPCSRRLEPGKTPTALTESTTQAVRALAAADGVVLPKFSSGAAAATGATAALILAVVVSSPRRAVACVTRSSPERGRRQERPRWRAITIRWTSLVPSPISRIFWSR